MNCLFMTGFNSLPFFWLTNTKGVYLKWKKNMQTKTSADVIYGFMLVSNYYMPLKITQQIKRQTILV